MIREEGGASVNAPKTLRDHDTGVRMEKNRTRLTVERLETRDNPGSFLNNLLGSELASVVRPMAFPLSEGISPSQQGTLTRVIYNRLYNFYLRHKSQLGRNFAAQRGALLARALVSEAIGAWFCRQQRSLTGNPLLSC